MKPPSRTTERSWDWQNRREANTLEGRLVRHKETPAQWTGLALKSEPQEPQRLRSARYWQDFLGGKRTIDPSYPVKEEPSGKKVSLSRRNSMGSLQAMIDNSNPRETFGFRTKSVYKDGKLRSEHASSDEIHQSLTRSCSTLQPPKPQKKVNLQALASQISTLPGSVFRTDTRQVKQVKPRVDSQSHIATLPGPSNPGLEETHVNPMKKFVRCTNTSAETEAAIGPAREVSGPKNSCIPVSVDLPTYQSVGADDTDCKRGKRILSRKAHQQSSEEENFSKGCKGHPRASTAFTASFKLF